MMLVKHIRAVGVIFSVLWIYIVACMSYSSAQHLLQTISSHDGQPIVVNEQADTFSSQLHNIAFCNTFCSVVIPCLSLHVWQCSLRSWFGCCCVGQRLCDWLPFKQNKQLLPFLWNKIGLSHPVGAWSIEILPLVLNCIVDERLC